MVLPLILLALLMGNYLQAQDIVTSELLGISKSGRSIILDRGRLEGLKLGTYARLLQQKGTAENPTLHFIGYAEAIKVNEKISFWILKELTPNALPRPGNRIAYLTLEKNYLPGKSPTRILNKKVILANPKDLNQYKADVERGVPDEIVYSEKDYDSEKLAVETTPTVSHHIESTNFDGWFEKQGLKYVEDYMNLLETKYVDAGGKIADNLELRKKDTESAFEIQTAGMVEKTNRLKYGLKELYAESYRDQKLRTLKSQTLIKNTFDEYYENKREEREREVSREAQAKRIKEPEMWSADFNDSELRDYVVRTGIEREMIRQKLSLEEIIDHEILFTYSSSLADHTNILDPNHNGKNYAVAVAYEFHMSRVNKKLDKWTLDAAFERQLAKYEVGPGLNGRFEDSSLRLGVNYYFIGNADRLNQFSWYLGTGIRIGQAKMESFLIDATYDYEMSGFPSWALGMKYRFRAGDDVRDIVKIGFGLNFKILYETVKYSILDSVINPGVDGSVSVNDTKFAFGISVYF